MTKLLEHALRQIEQLPEGEQDAAAGALLEGHFILSSGLHSPSYLQCALVLMNSASDMVLSVRGRGAS